MKIPAILFLLLAHIPAQARLFHYVDPSTGATVITNQAIAAREKRSGSGQRSAGFASTNSRDGNDSGFPVVSQQLQRIRDNDRIRILQAELAQEKEALRTVVEKGADADIVHRHEMNIAALEREVRNAEKRDNSPRSLPGGRRRLAQVDG